MRRLGVLILLTGCKSLLGIEDVETVIGDAAPDQAVGDGLTALCHGTLARICFDEAPSAAVVLTDAIKTDGDPRCRVVPQGAGLTELCVIEGKTITVLAATTVIGTRALVLVASEEIRVNAPLDASSRLASDPGAGASAITCASDSGKDSTTGSGGGGGGSFGAIGGRGGEGASQTPGGLAAAAAPTIASIRGGCSGGSAGVGEGAGSGGLGGAGGGAIALIAGMSITIEATGGVYASGAGGQRGNPQDGSQGRGGGGGGGSGGLIVLEAPQIFVNGPIAANGGGGGGGGDCCSGFDGADGSTVSFDLPAAGGLNEGNNHGGPGGAGGAVASAAASGLPPAGGGGGGGGGGAVGVVWTKGALAGTRISPAPTTN